MTESITWYRPNPDTISGHKLIIIHTFTSQNIEAINELQEYCKEHIGSAIKIEYEKNLKEN